MVCGVKLRRVISSIMRRRKGVMCGSFASERDGVRDNPFTMPHRSREGAQENQRVREVTRCEADDSTLGKDNRGEMPVHTKVERKLVLAHREAV